MTSIDLNADLGEGETATGDLLAIVSSCNIACGGHAGDPESMTRTLVAAARHGVAAGAHPAYADREGFGRRPRRQAGDALYRSLAQQVTALADLAADLGITLTHVKPHGALYHDAARDDAVADIVARVVDETPGHLALVGPPGSCLARAARHARLPFVGEAFADRRYRSDGTLVPRNAPGAVLADPGEIAGQALSIARDRAVTSDTGTRLRIDADTLCLHGDNPRAVAAARAVRSALDDAGIIVRRPEALRG